ncbi:MAG: hypothetical protein COT90_04170 [Candidatus Diapherotrites archaeon CG10_big_fil_rev_8_21_14_0_10_31_34]|nr:MAG: hypothetical protein COT90_04170 [Candidatus Diapherotrites archaeon CG10_big_fil_rev_8_21_14_0_10_31_34]
MKEKKQEKDLKTVLIKTGKTLLNRMPFLLPMILLIALVNSLISKSFYSTVFQGNLFVDSFIGSLVGSISAGDPSSSYVLGGEFLNQGVNLIVVTAFLVSWVTVGLIQLPAEISFLGKKFVLLRNFTAFILSVFVAVSTVFLWSVL